MLALGFQLRESGLQLRLDVADGALHAFWSRHVMGRWEDVHLLVFRQNFSCHRVQRHQSFDVISEHLDTNGMFLIHRKDLNSVATNTKGATLEGNVVSGVLDVDQHSQESVPFPLLPDA